MQISKVGDGEDGDGSLRRRTQPSASFTRCSTVRLARARPWSPRLFGGGYCAQDVGLDEVVPTAGSAYLDHVNGELLLCGRESDEFVRRSRRPGQGSQLLAEDPGHEGELLLTADGAHHVAPSAVKFRGTKQVRICVADRCHTRSSRIDLGQQRPTLKGVVHHLSLKSHGNQSTCGREHAGWATPIHSRRAAISHRRRLGDGIGLFSMYRRDTFSYSVANRIR